ncbi:MAG: hypothetical protein HN348_13245 [Proteobacteria bacterium]|jgi:hypothetical protein|nr:hypothetical protein [Pseudomonadota bacterium]
MSVLDVSVLGQDLGRFVGLGQGFALFEAAMVLQPGADVPPAQDRICLRVTKDVWVEVEHRIAADTGTVSNVVDAGRILGVSGECVRGKIEKMPPE